MSRRLGTIGIVMVLLFVLLAGWTAYLQFWHAGALDKSPDNPRNQNTSSNFARGEIFAANGDVLAESVPTGYGVNNYPWKRKYPLGSLTSAVVGLSSNYYQWGGMETEYNSELEAHALAPQSLSQLLAPDTGTDSISITLQPALQRVAQTALMGRDGAVVALDPRTGAVLAMYSNPSYNPNTIEAHGYGPEVRAWESYLKKDVHGYSALATLATQQTFPPGSTFKVITTAAVVAHDPSLFTLSIPVMRCLKLPFSNVPLCNDGQVPCGGTITVMLPASCDPGYAQIGLDLGANDLTDEAGAFGYNNNIPIDLPGVVPSFFPNRHVFADDKPQLAYSAIGQQNVRTTALQNALVASAIANGGVMMTPHFLNQVIGPDGSVLTTYKPTPWRQAISASQAAQIAPLMRDVVTEGTAYYVGFLPQDDVAAKTGTAQTGDVINHDTDDWMIAFAPATDPVIAVAVVVPYQNVSATGAEIAGPVMKCVIEAALALNAGAPTANTASTCAS